MDDSRRSDGVLLRFDEPGTARALVLEDDGRVAYAYLLEHEDVVGDVWLYNVNDAPVSEDWHSQSEMPFLNPMSYCSDEKASRLAMGSSITCVWCDEGVDVTIDGTFMARLCRGTKPGWSRYAIRPGPLAKPLRPGGKEAAETPERGQ